MQTCLVQHRRLGLAVGLLLLLVAACRPNTPSPTPIAATSTPVTTGADDWARIQATGKLVVGTSADYAPFAFYTANFTLDGFDVALARALGQRLGLEVEIKDFAFEGLLDALHLGQIDVAIAAISVTPAREQIADFTRVYYVGEDAILARQDATISAIRQPQEMSNYRIGVQAGSVYATWLDSTLLDPGLLAPDHLIVYNEIERAITELRQIRIDVAAPPPTPIPVAPIIYAFNASQNSIMIGSCVSLRWEVGGTLTQLRLYRNGQLLMDNIGQRHYNDCPNFGGNLDFRLEVTNGRTTQYANQTVTVIVRQPR